MDRGQTEVEINEKVVNVQRQDVGKEFRKPGNYCSRPR